MGLFDLFRSFDPSDPEQVKRRVERICKYHPYIRDPELLKQVIEEYPDRDSEYIVSIYCNRNITKRLCIIGPCVTYKNEKSSDIKDQPRMKTKIHTHGASWFLAGIGDPSLCPECEGEISFDPHDNDILFEHPKKEGSSWHMKCQCNGCGCVFMLTRSEKDIMKGIKNEEEDGDEDED